MTLFVILTLICVDEWYVKLQDDSPIKLFMGSIVLLTQGICWYYFTKKHHDVIFNKYTHESDVQKKKRGWIVLLYVIFSVSTLLFVAYIGNDISMNYKQGVPALAQNALAFPDTARILSR